MVTLLVIILVLALIVLVVSIIFKIIGFTLFSIFRHPLITAAVIVAALFLLYLE